jgi:lipoprotein-releasing system permease protein
MIIGLLIVVYLDKIEAWLSWLMGHNLFDRDLYYFDRIPTVIDAWNITWIVLGALCIAVGSSVLPALRAAALRPVQSLRYE